MTDRYALALFFMMRDNACDLAVTYLEQIFARAETRTNRIIAR